MLGKVFGTIRFQGKDPSLLFALELCHGGAWGIERSYRQARYSTIEAIFKKQFFILSSLPNQVYE